MQPKQTPEDWDRSGLPAWTFFSEELTEIEKEVLFRRHWQIACHVSDIPDPGCFVTLDIAGERAAIVRDKGGEVRAFHNLCRHRGSRVLAEQSGRCRGPIICPFHGWSYNLDGTLRKPFMPDSLPKLDPVEWGLKPIEIEIWMGFVFIRFKQGDQPAVAALLQRHEAEVAPYKTATMAPVYGEVWTNPMEVNWKAVRDVDNEGYHVPMAHPSLHALYGPKYYDEPLVDGSSRSFGSFTDGEHGPWSVRQYKKIVPERPELPTENQRAWLYIGIFPNQVIGLYPDSVIYYQEHPLSAGKTIQRGSTYRYPDEDRQTRAARYLSGRIDGLTVDEDTQLIEWTCEAMQSSAFDGIILSDAEYGVRSYHDALRAKIPAMRLREAPEPGTLAAHNAEMASAV